MKSPKLSILICSLVYRREKLNRLLSILYHQVITNGFYSDVEILFDIDNKEVTTGEKRNRLLDRATGQYIAFIDDDDIVYSNYLKLQLKGCEAGCDCIGSQGHYSVNGGEKVLWKLSMRYTDHDSIENGKHVLYRRTNHISAVKRELAVKAKFPHKSNAEDKAYSERLNPLLKSEYVIEEPIYHYDYETFNKQY